MRTTELLACCATALFVVLATAMPMQGATLFFDSFDRPDNRNLDAVTTGITDNTGSSLVADGVYSQPHVDPNNELGGPDSSPAGGGGAQILSGELELADVQGTSNAYVNHNFTNASILTAGGFRVSVDVTAFNQSNRQQGGGFAIGMSQTEADSTGDSFDKVNPVTTGAFHSNPEGIIGNPVSSNIVSDFWIGIRGNQSLAWGGSSGDTLGVGGLGAKTGTIAVNFLVSDFNAGSTVNYRVFLDDVLQGTGALTWSGTNENYIALDARDNQGVFFDNFLIETIPEPTSIALIGTLAIIVGSTSRSLRR